VSSGKTSESPAKKSVDFHEGDQQKLILILNIGQYNSITPNHQPNILQPFSPHMFDGQQLYHVITPINDASIPMKKLKQLQLLVQTPG